MAQWLWRLQSDILGSSPAVPFFFFFLELLSARADWIPTKLHKYSVEKYQSLFKSKNNVEV